MWESAVRKGCGKGGTEGGEGAAIWAQSASCFLFFSPPLRFKLELSRSRSLSPLLLLPTAHLAEAELELGGRSKQTVFFPEEGGSQAA